MAYQSTVPTYLAPPADPARSTPYSVGYGYARGDRSSVPMVSAWSAIHRRPLAMAGSGTVPRQSVVSSSCNASRASISDATATDVIPLVSGWSVGFFFVYDHPPSADWWSTHADSSACQYAAGTSSPMAAPAATPATAYWDRLWL